MKANELQKKPITIENIYDGIKSDNDIGHFKHLVPHFMVINDGVKEQLLKDGFKLSYGTKYGHDEGLIIEW